MPPVTQEEGYQETDEEEEDSLHIPARMDLLPSTQEDATYHDLQEQLDMINTFGTPQADPKAINDFLEKFDYEKEFDSQMLANLSLPDLPTSNASSTVPDFTGSSYNPKEKNLKILLSRGKPPETVIPDKQLSSLSETAKEDQLAKARKEAEKEVDSEEEDNALLESDPEDDSKEDEESNQDDSSYKEEDESHEEADTNAEAEDANLEQEKSSNEDVGKREDEGNPKAELEKKTSI